MQVAVVTGASSGIGRAIAQRFVNEGLRVVGLSRRAESAPGGVDCRAIDLQDLAAVSSVLLSLREELQAASSVCLVHNASDLPADSIDAVDAAVMERTLRLNAVVPSVLSAGLVPLMRPGSSIVYLGSTLSEKAAPGRLSYVVAKHAVVGLMRATCQDLQGKGIHTACVCPGFTDTAMLRPILAQDPAVESAVLGSVGYGRLVKPEEIAEVVDAVRRSPVLNGAVIHANLGQKES